MRASRLLAMLLALQHRGRTTAAQLAVELEVSTRTVLRDVEALSEAGVPVFAVQGAGGGIELVDGFEARLTGFTRDEAAGVLLAGQPALAALLGLGAVAQSARHRLLRALPDPVAAQAAAVDEWFLHDPVGRDGAAVAGDVLAGLARAVRLRVEVELAVDGGEPEEDAPGSRRSGDAAPPPEVLRPLGLVLAAGTWHLVHLTADGPQTRTLPPGTRPPVLRRRFDRPADVDLAAFWFGSRRPGP